MLTHSASQGLVVVPFYGTYQSQSPWESGLSQLSAPAYNDMTISSQIR